MPQLPVTSFASFTVLSNEERAGSFPPLGSNLKVLMVWPRFPPSFWGLEGMFEVIPEQATMPPLGLITVAALCPPTWEVRLLDTALEELRDEDLLWADLVMVSAMAAQRADAKLVLKHARRLGRRTFIGGPWASSEPEALLPEADHVFVGEAEEVFADVAKSLEDGSARRLYRVSDKPDMRKSPVPRYDLLRLDKYGSMSVQFSRGCPFQCEFCDIITIYGRRPRVKASAQVLEELETLRKLGWRKQVFIVDDNFIGNHREALALSHDLTVWQDANRHPFSFYTEASIDLADRPELLKAMVEANFLHVFIGIETPSAAALKESRKFQNLRHDNLDQIHRVQQSGLWVTGGFIVGFDSDDESIFERQRRFVDQTGIAWAMIGLLQAPPTTALYDRVKAEGRLLEETPLTTNFSAPNFRTALPLPIMLRGLASLLNDLYEPEPFFRRALRSLEVWQPQPCQRPPKSRLSYMLGVCAKSMWRQGVRSNYRRIYWRSLGLLVIKSGRQPAKRWVGLMALISGHHFISYARIVADELKQQCTMLDEARL